MGIIEYCQQNDMLFIAWRPLQKGLLLEEYDENIEYVMKKYKKTLAQIAINWLISQDKIITLSKMTSSRHLEENLGAIGWNMDADDIELLRTSFPVQHVVSDAVPLKEWE